MAVYMKSQTCSRATMCKGNTSVLQSADDLACCKALVHKHHRDFLLLIMGFEAKSNETCKQSQLDKARPANYTQVRCTRSETTILKLTSWVIECADTTMGWQ